MGESADAFLRQDAHVDLQAEQRKDRQREERQDDDVTQILDRLDDGTHDRLQACNRPHMTRFNFNRTSVLASRAPHPFIHSFSTHIQLE